MLELFTLSLSLLSMAGAARHIPRAEVNSTVLGDSMVSSAWYAGWHAEDFPISKISWSKYTHMAYAFAVTTPEVDQVSLEESDEELLPKFVSAAHQNGVKAMLSIGGWTGSRWFSSHFASADNRTAFVKTVTDLVEKYDLDGIDIDWEYPARQGLGCNVVSTDDTPNFLSFLQELRSTSTGQSLIVSAATGLQPFNDTSLSPSKDVSAFAKVLDFIEIMDYDVWSPLSTAGAGPNAPLNDTCAPSTQERTGSAVSAVQAWSNAGFPRNQIVLGVAAYGHSYRVSNDDAYAQSGNGSSAAQMLAQYPAFSKGKTPTGDKWDGPFTDPCGVEEGVSGVFSFWGLMDGGFLKDDGSVEDGIIYRYDNCSQTPYVYNADTQILVSYDNQQSFAVKGDFIRSSGLRGFAMWEAGGDSDDMLLDSILLATAQGASAKTGGSPSGSGASSTPTSNAVLPSAQCTLLGSVACALLLGFVMSS